MKNLTIKCFDVYEDRDLVAVYTNKKALIGKVCEDVSYTNDWNKFNKDMDLYTSACDYEVFLVWYYWIDEVKYITDNYRELEKIYKEITNND